MRRRTLLENLAAGTVATPWMASPGRAEGQASSPAIHGPSPRPVALCIGISSYSSLPTLATASADALRLARKFDEIGVAARTLLDPSLDQILLGLARFRLLASKAETTVIYVAGHGCWSNGQSSVFAADASPGARETLPVIPESIFLQAVSDRPRSKVLFLDTCRNPTSLARLANRTYVPSAFLGLGGTFTLSAAQPGARAYDDINGRSPFANALSKQLAVPNLDIESLARRVRVDVIRRTQGLQIPWSRSSLVTPITLNNIDQTGG